MPLLGAIAVAEVPLLGASYQLWRSSRWVPLLGAMQGCHCWVLATNFGGGHVGCTFLYIDNTQIGLCYLGSMLV